MFFGLRHRGDRPLHSEATSRSSWRDAGIVRNRAKIEATVNNAKRYRDLVAGGQPGGVRLVIRTRCAIAPKKLDWEQLRQMTTSSEAIAMSKDLRKRGWASWARRLPTRSCRRWVS